MRKPISLKYLNGLGTRPEPTREELKQVLVNWICTVPLPQIANVLEQGGFGVYAEELRQTEIRVQRYLQCEQPVEKK